MSNAILLPLLQVIRMSMVRLKCCYIPSNILVFYSLLYKKGIKT